LPGRRVAGAGVVALVARDAGDGCAGGAGAGLAGFRAVALVAVGAGGAVRFVGVRALAGRRVAGAGVVA